MSAPNLRMGLGATIAPAVLHIGESVLDDNDSKRGNSLANRLRRTWSIRDAGDIKGICNQINGHTPNLLEIDKDPLSWNSSSEPTRFGGSVGWFTRLT